MTIGEGALALQDAADVPRRPVDNPTSSDRFFRGRATAAASVSLVIVCATLFFLVKESRPALNKAGIGYFFTNSIWNPGVGMALSVAIPATTPTGAHTIEIAGTLANGQEGTHTVAVVVTEPTMVTTLAVTPLGSDTSSSGSNTATVSSGSLPRTGSSTQLPLIGFGIVLIGAGLGIATSRGRRSAIRRS